MFNKMRKILSNHTVKNGILFTIYSFINSGFSFVLLLILAKYISPNDYGLLNLFTIFIQVLTIFICLGTQGYVAVSFFRGSENKYKFVMTFVFFVSTIVFLLYTALLLLLPSYFEVVIGLKIHYLLLATFVCYMQVYNSQFLGLLRINESVGMYGVFSVSNAFLSLVLSLIFVVSLGQGWHGRVFTTVILAVFYFIISITYFIRNKLIVLKIPNKDLCYETLAYGLPLLPHHVGVWVRQSFDRFVINSYHTSSLVGLYGFAGNFANILLMIGTAFNAVNSVQIYKELANGYMASKVKLDNIVKYTTIFYLVTMIVLFLGCYFFIPVLFSDYKSSVRYLLPLMLSSFFQCIYLLHVNYLFFYKKTIVLMYITVTMSIVQLLLSILFTKYDVIYAAIINLIVNGVICLSVAIYKKRICKNEEINIVNDKKID